MPRQASLDNDKKLEFYIIKNGPQQNQTKHMTFSEILLNFPSLRRCDLNWLYQNEEEEPVMYYSRTKPGLTDSTIVMFKLPSFDGYSSLAGFLSKDALWLFVFNSYMVRNGAIYKVIENLSHRDFVDGSSLFHISAYDAIIKVYISTIEMKIKSTISAFITHFTAENSAENFGNLRRKHIKPYIKIKSSMNSIRFRAEELIAWLKNEESSTNEEGSKKALLRKCFDLAVVPGSSMVDSNNQYENIREELLDDLQRKCKTCINQLTKRLTELEVIKKDLIMKSDCREQNSRIILAYNTVVTISCNVGVYLTGLFGMNLDNWDTLAPIKNGFLYLNLAFAAGMIIVFAILYAYVYTSFHFATDSAEKIKDKNEDKQVESSTANILFEYKVIRREECSPPDDASAQVESSVPSVVSVKEYKESLLDLKGLIKEIVEQDARSEDSSGDVPQHRDLRPFISPMDENFDPWIRRVGGMTVFAIYPFRMIVNSSFAMVVAPAEDDKGLNDVKEEFKVVMPTIREKLRKWLTHGLNSNKQLLKKDFALSVFSRIMMVSKYIREEKFQAVMENTGLHVRKPVTENRFAYFLDRQQQLQSMNISGKNAERYEESNDEIIRRLGEGERELAVQLLQAEHIVDFLRKMLDKLDENIDEKDFLNTQDEIEHFIEELLREYEGFVSNIQKGLQECHMKVLSKQAELDTEEVVQTKRDLFFVTVGTSLGFGCFVTATFGANLDQAPKFIQTHGFFIGLIISTTVFMVIVVWIVLGYIHEISIEKEYPCTCDICSKENMAALKIQNVLRMMLKRRQSEKMLKAEQVKQ